MKILKLTVDFYLKTNMHTGFAVWCLLQITIIKLKINSGIYFDYFVVAGTIFAYNFLKYIEIFYLKKIKIQQYLDVVLVSFFAFCGMVFSFFELQNNIKIAFLQIGLLVLLYPILRKFGLLKMFVVAFCVTIITVYIPCLQLEFLPNKLYVLLLQRFLIITSLIIPFEILDAKNDAQYLTTIPILFGSKATKIFGAGLIFLFLVLNLAHFELHKFVIDLCIALITVLFITFSNTNQSKYYTLFWVESVPIVWFFLYKLIVK